jgi:hypothetical protein
MKKLVLCLAALAVVSAPASAATKKAKAAKVAPAAQSMSPNEASWRLVRESLPLFLPSVGQWIYFHQRDELAKAEMTKTAAHKTH